MAGIAQCCQSPPLAGQGPGKTGSTTVSSRFHLSGTPEWPLDVAVAEGGGGGGWLQCGGYATAVALL